MHSSCSYSNFKMTPECSKYSRVMTPQSPVFGTPLIHSGTPWCPKYRGFVTPQYPKYWGVATPQYPQYQGVVTPQCSKYWGVILQFQGVAPVSQIPRSCNSPVYKILGSCFTNSLNLQTLPLAFKATLIQKSD